MSDLENLSASEGQESDPQALERLRERMAASAAAMKKDQKDESKQHKSETDLAAILRRFLMSRKKSDPILLLVVSCLEQNIAPVFVMALLLLIEKNNESEISKMFPALESPEGKKLAEYSTFVNALGKAGLMVDSLDASKRLEFNFWLNNLKKTADSKANSMKINLVEPDGIIKACVVQLMSFVMADFFGVTKAEESFKSLQIFAIFVLNGIYKNLQIPETKLLEGES
jgi:hypothetical protein